MKIGGETSTIINDVKNGTTKVTLSGKKNKKKTEKVIQYKFTF